MKNYKIVILLFIALSAVVFACNKSTSGSTATTKPTLVLSKSVIKIGEPLVVTTKGQASGSSVHWSASTNASIWTSSSGDSATFLFTSAGSYQVGASYASGGSAAYDSSNSSITVSDSLYTDTNTVHCDAILSVPIGSGDQVILTPISYSDSAGLVFLAYTQNIYNYLPSLTYTGNLSGTGGTYECDFNAITEYPCNGFSLPTPATGDVFFYSLTNGTHDLVFKLNGTTYQGSLTVSNTTCTFTWNYNSGVTISPLQIQKVQ